MIRPGPSDEVRQCVSCRQAALICIRDWQHRLIGVDLPTWTLDYECQACGVKITLLPQRKIRAERLIAYLLIPAIFPSLYFFASARRKARAWTDNPVVPGASQPNRRVFPAAQMLDQPYRDPHARVCACRGAAQCTAIAQKRLGSMSIGSRYEYHCRQCTKAFAVHDDRALIFSFVLASALCAVSALIILNPPGSAVGAEQSNRWFGVALLVFAAIGYVSFAFRIRARLSFPKLK